MVTIEYPQGRYEGEARFVRVHVRRNNRWQVVLYQVTRVQPR